MTYEEQIILVNNQQIQLGYEAISTFLYEEDDINIHDPFYDSTGRFEVNPIEEYGDSYLKWQKELIEFQNKCQIIFLDNDMNVILLKNSNDYTYVYDDSSCQGTKEEILKELIDFKILSINQINKITI